LVTDLQIGGTPTVVRELAVRLSCNARHDSVHVACLAEWGPVADQIQHAGIPVTALKAHTMRDLFVVSRLRRLIEDLGIDTILSFLVHANAVAAAVSLFTPGIRLIESIQTTQPEPRWHWRVQGWASRAAEKIVVPSPSVAGAARDWSAVPAAKIIVIPNAVSLDEFAHLRLRPRQLYDRAVPIGFIGRLDPIKRIPDLLKAVRLLKDLVHLHIFGEGPQRPHLERCISEWDLSGRVTLHGAIAHPREALAQIELLVLPSAAEGFGLVLIEAMAAGVPVVATQVPGIRDVVQNERTGLLVPAASPGDLARAITRIIQDGALREQLITCALREVQARYTWDVILPQYIRLLSSGQVPA
jgi:glycosyltransferase involved in cell wall biosynthesis